MGFLDWLRSGDGGGSTWGKAEKHNDGYMSRKDEHGTLFSKNVENDGSIDRDNHIHFHEDGTTVTHDGHKTTVSSGWFSSSDSSDSESESESESESSDSYSSSDDSDSDSSDSSDSDSGSSSDDD